MSDNVRDPLAADLIPPQPGATDAELRTFLIADVRGYTSFTQRHGDERAAKLAGKFAQVAREVVEQHQGTVLELRGDEALCVFVSPRQAVRCAVALQRRFVDETRWDSALPLPVGIGIDVGEAVPVEGGYRSGALNLAARLCSLAKPGEILATPELTHLARRLDGMSYVAKDPVRLKGLPEPVRPVRVVPDGEDPVAQLVGLGALPPKPPVPLAGPAWLPKPLRRRPWFAVVAGAVVVALVAVGIVVGSSGSSNAGLRALRENVVASIDPASGRLTDQVDVGRDPSAVVAAYGALWTANVDDGTVTRIDIATQRVRQTVQVGVAPTGVAAGGGAIWVANSGSGTVSRVDARSGRVTESVAVGNAPSALTYANGAVWVVDTTGNAVYRLDATKTTPTLVAHVGGSPTAVAVEGSRLWVSSLVTATVVEIDARTGETLDTVHVGNDPGALALTGDSVWVANNADGTVTRILRSTATVTATLRVGDGPVAIAGAAGLLWVAAADGRSVTRIDPRDNRVLGSVSTASTPAALAVGADRLWVAAGSNPALHRGGTLTVSVPNAPYQDPARGYDPPTEELLSSSYDGLLTLRRAPGALGTTVVPDLAVALPSVSGDGLTYTFRLRSGIRWSTGALVTGADVRRGLERTVAAGIWPLYSGIVGADSCSHTRCDLSRAITWNATTRLLTIRLTAPDPEFTYKVALLGAVAVPADTPLGKVHDPIPATGPYVVAHRDKNGLELARNPRFHEWSAAAQPAGFPDRIVVTVHASASPGQQWTVPNADWVTTSSIPDVEALRQKYGDRVREVPTLSTFYVWLDASHPPFDDVRARRAVAFALNRASMAAEWPVPGQVTCQILAPGIPGYQPYCPFTSRTDVPGQWRAPNLTRAQRLVRASGTGGDVVRVIAPGGMHAMAQVADTMRALGYRARVVYTPAQKYFPEVFRRTGHVEAGFDAWGADYPSADNFLQTQLACDQFVPTGSNFSFYCDPKLDRMMQRALRVEASAPDAAAARWAAVERRAVNSAALIGIVNGTKFDIVSSRLGHAETNIVIGALFDQAWVH